MENLSLMRKIEGYQYALKHIDNPKTPIYVCSHLAQFMVRKTIGGRINMSINKCVKTYFPEFWAERTEYGEDHVGWWPIDEAGRLRRKAVITLILNNLRS